MAEKITSNKEINIQENGALGEIVLRKYAIEKGVGIFRVFINLGLNFHENSKKEIEKLQNIMLKGEKGNKPLGIMLGDVYELDINFIVHIKRDGKEIYKYPLFKDDSQEIKKNAVKDETKSKLLKQREEMDVEKRVKELVSELDEESRFSYYLQIAKEVEEESVKKDEIKKHIIEPAKKKDEKSKSSQEKEGNRLKKQKPKLSLVAKKEEKVTPIKKESTQLKQTAKKESGIKLSKEMKRKIWNHIEHVNPDFKEHLGHVLDLAREYNLDPALLIAVIQNDTGLGKHMYSRNNFGNVGNHDKLVAAGKRGVEYRSARAGIKAVAKNLRNRIDSYKEAYPGKNPSTQEILTGLSKEGVKFYGPYMTKPTGALTVAMLVDDIKN